MRNDYSTNPWQRLGEGRTAELYAIDAEKVVKLYRDGFPVGDVQYEYAVHQLVAQLGIATPRAYEVIEADRRNGIVYERLAGTTLLRRIVQAPEELPLLTEQFTELHIHIHRHALSEEQAKGTPIRRQKQVLARHIRNAPLLSDEKKRFILAYLDKLPDGNVLCHGDYHPDNVMVGERSSVIDWMTGMLGNPAGDVARTYLLFRFGTLPDEAPSSVVEALDRMRKLINEIYLESYRACTGIPIADIEAWLLPVAAARLSEGIPEEEKAELAAFIEQQGCR